MNLSALPASITFETTNENWEETEKDQKVIYNPTGVQGEEIELPFSRYKINVRSIPEKPGTKVIRMLLKRD